MDPADLLVALHDPEVLGHPAGTPVTVVQTHISIVALVGDDVFKFKKPVDLEFLDYTTLERRQHFCQQEVLLNRRLAPDVYLGVAELRRDHRDPPGRLRLGGHGELIDVAVHMRRLPDEASLARRLAADAVDAAVFTRLGALLDAFHRAAHRGPEVSAFATYAAVAANARQNFVQLAAVHGVAEPDAPVAPIPRRSSARRAAAHRSPSRPHARTSVAPQANPEAADTRASTTPTPRTDAHVAADLVAAQASSRAEHHAHAVVRAEHHAHAAAHLTADLDAPTTRTADPARTARARLLARLEHLTETTLSRLHPLIDARARRHLACDTHGDLRLEHIYLFPERAPPGDLVILDCIEFNAQFRSADPVADLAFLVMDLDRVDRRDLAEALLAGYFATHTPAEQAEARALLPFYTAYRATVRAKVEAMKAAEPEIPADIAASARHAEIRLLLLALREISPPALRPCLALVAGLPGTGKSTLARTLAAEGFHWVRSDAVRKQLAGLSSETSARSDQDAGIYTPAWTARTYDRCRELARHALAEGQRVVVDANFKSAEQRAMFARLARELGVPLHLFVCQTDPATVHERLSRRTGDASDADVAIYEAARAAWEPLTPAEGGIAVDTTGSPESAAAAVLAAIRGSNLA